MPVSLKKLVDARVLQKKITPAHLRGMLERVNAEENKSGKQAIMLEVP